MIGGLEDSEKGKGSFISVDKCGFSDEDGWQEQGSFTDHISAAWPLMMIMIIIMMIIITFSFYNHDDSDEDVWQEQGSFPDHLSAAQPLPFPGNWSRPGKPHHGGGDDYDDDDGGYDDDGFDDDDDDGDYHGEVN